MDPVDNSHGPHAQHALGLIDISFARLAGQQQARISQGQQAVEEACEDLPGRGQLLHSCLQLPAVRTLSLCGGYTRNNLCLLLLCLSGLSASTDKLHDAGWQTSLSFLAWVVHPLDAKVPGSS